MQCLFLVLSMAVVVEALVEYVKTVIHLFTRQEYKTAITQMLTLGCSIWLCLAAGADLFAAVGLHLEPAWLGSLLTGIFSSRGANYVSDLAALLRRTAMED